MGKDIQEKKVKKVKAPKVVEKEGKSKKKDW